MMNKIYPLKFNTTLKERVWGGKKLVTSYNKPVGNEFDSNNLPNIGESWEITGFKEDSSIIANGFLEDNSLYDVIETYMGDLVGENVYELFGNEFPLLIKLLDINDLLSVQVHPDNDTAFDRHNSYGKTEAWYVLEASEDAKVYMGFNRDVTAQEFMERCKNNTLEEILNVYHPQKGDFFYVEAGVIHSAGGGLVIAEVQQLSDVTYRIYDWGRENDPTTAREMHLDLAIDSINYNKYDESKYYFPASSRKKADMDKLIDNEFFTVTSIDLKNPLHIPTENINSFILYFCSQGSASITPENTKATASYDIAKGEWIMIPASYEDFTISSTSPNTKLLEIHIENYQENDSYLLVDKEGDTEVEDQ